MMGRNGEEIQYVIKVKLIIRYGYLVSAPGTVHIWPV